MYWLPLYHCSTVWLLSWMTNTKVSHTYHFGPEIKYSSKIRKKLTTIVINIAANKWLPNIGQNKLWWRVHIYKGLTSIFEEVASEVWALVWPTRKMPSPPRSKKLKKNGGKKNGKKNKKSFKKSGGEKSKQAVVEVASELLFGLAVKCLEIQLFWLKKKIRL